METTEEDKKNAAKKDYLKQYYINNAEAIKERRKKYREEKSNSIKNYNKEYGQKNKECIKSKKKKYYVENSEHIKTKANKYYSENSDGVKKRQKNYYIENSEKIKLRVGKYTTNRRKTDPVFKMLGNFRHRIYLALKNQGATKDIRSKDLFGATQEFVWKHLESKFKEGMTRFNNTSKGWHIDHIIPMSSFGLLDPVQLRACNHYSNLQPLWWWENLEKSDKIS